MVTLNFIRKHAVVLSVLAIAGTTLMSFEFNSKKMEETKFADQYWNFTGDDPLDPNDYTPAPQDEGCNTGSEVCQIFAPSNNSPTNPKPDLSATAPNHGSQSVSQRIENALTTGGNETVTMKN